MGVEIERKFLVASAAWRGQGKSTPMRQGYLSSQPERTVRVRIEGDAARLTVKGKSVGATRAEWEYAVPVKDAEEMLEGLCERPFIDKIRHAIPFGGLVWEVDEFFGENAGLVVAEVELASEDQVFEKPLWLGAEVTGDARYFNANLLKFPYKDWLEAKRIQD